MSENERLQSILKWSLTQSDGTAPARQISEDERKWFHEAVGSHLVDIVQRMKEITAVMAVGEEALLKQGVEVGEIAGVLEELQEHVESIDMANDLKAVGGLEPLLAFLHSPHAILRARAAEVLSTMVQNNPKSQENVMQAGGMVMLCNMFLSDKDVVARTKALGAISSLVRHNSEGLSSFRTTCGAPSLVSVLDGDDVRLKRKALNLLKYLLEEYPVDRKACMEQGAGLKLSSLLLDSEEDVRVSAIHVLMELASFWPSGEGGKAEVEKAVDDRIAQCNALSGEDQADAAEESKALYILKDKLARPPSVPSAFGGAHASQSPMLLGGPFQSS